MHPESEGQQWGCVGTGIDPREAWAMGIHTDSLTGQYRVTAEPEGKLSGWPAQEEGIYT